MFDISILGDTDLVIKYGDNNIAIILPIYYNINDINTNNGKITTDIDGLHMAIFYCQINVVVIFGVKNNGDINIAIPR